jgi:hypothetical protein
LNLNFLGVEAEWKTYRTVKCSFLSWRQARAMGLIAMLLGKVLDHINSLKLLCSLPAGKSLQEGFALKEGGLHT